MKKVLVTGSSGYIGKHLCKLLLDHGYEVHGHDIVDNSCEGTILHSLDIREPHWTTTMKFDTVVHLAALVRVNESIARPYDYYDTNINGTYNVLKYTPCDNFIFASTGAAENPIVPYSLSKRVAEDIVKEYCVSNNKDYTIFRFYNVIGSAGFPPTNPDGLFYNLIKAEETGWFNLFGDDYNTDDGSAIRDYVHVMEICHSIMMAIEEPANGLENLGHGVGHSVFEICRGFMQANGKNFNIKCVPRRDGDAERTVLKDVSRYMKELYTFEELMKK